jgi:hypothetical protein
MPEQSTKTITCTERAKLGGGTLGVEGCGQGAMGIGVGVFRDGTSGAGTMGSGSGS